MFKQYFLTLWHRSRTSNWLWQARSTPSQVWGFQMLETFSNLVSTSRKKLFNYQKRWASPVGHKNHLRLKKKIRKKIYSQIMNKKKLLNIIWNYGNWNSFFVNLSLHRYGTWDGLVSVFPLLMSTKLIKQTSCIHLPFPWWRACSLMTKLWKR